MQVHLASEELGELALQIDELEEADPRLGGELDQHVDVALGAEVFAKDGAEEGEATNAGAPAEGSQSIRVDIETDLIVAELFAWIWWEDLSYLEGLDTEMTLKGSANMLARLLDRISAPGAAAQPAAAQCVPAAGASPFSSLPTATD